MGRDIVLQNAALSSAVAAGAATSAAVPNADDIDMEDPSPSGA